MEGGAAVEDTDIIQLYWARDEGAIAATDGKIRHAVPLSVP